MKLSSAVQESVVALILFDKLSGSVLRGMLPAKTFDPFYREIVAEAGGYWDRYQRPPGEHALDLFDLLQQRTPDSKTIYSRIWESIQEVKDGINAEYVMGQAMTFARYQRLRVGIGEAIDALELDTEEGVNAASVALNRAQELSADLFDPGLDIRDPSAALAFLDDDDDYFLTGIPELDVHGLGPGRRKLHLTIAPYGTGKTWWLERLMKVNFIVGHRVLYVSLEMDPKAISERFHRDLFALGRRKGKANWLTWDRDEKGHVIGTLEHEAVREFTRSKTVRRYLEKKRKVLERRPPLFIKGFPSGSLTIRQFVSYLDMLEGRGFIPDLILVDYADLFKVSAENKRNDLSSLYVDIRGVAQERNIAIATASQMNRSGAGKKIGTGRDVAEDWSKMGTVDTAFTFNQTPAEKDLGFLRIFVDKGRNEADKFTVHICQNLDLGQFAVDSSRMVGGYWKMVGTDDQPEED